MSFYYYTIMTVYCQQPVFIRTYGSDGKESACNAGDPGLTLELGRSPEGRNGNLLQYSCLENPMDRGAWRATVHGVAKESDMTEQLSTPTHTYSLDQHS